jgi:hypoxanthine phosphoribosyltransferase
VSAGDRGRWALLPRAELVCERATLEAAIARIGADVARALDNERAVFLTVMHGGMLFASALAFAIDRDLEFDYVHATRYRGATRGADLNWVHRPTARLASRTVILADDILDEGVTLAALRDHCVAAGARRVLIAVLCEKCHARRVPGLRADFVGVELPDRYLFGYGLDYQERGRNLPDIYAVADDVGCSL